MTTPKMKMLLLNVNKKEGIAKRSNQPYLFYQALLVDEYTGKTFKLFLDKEKMITTPQVEKDLLKLKNTPVEVQIRLNPMLNTHLTGTVTELIPL